MPRPRRPGSARAAELLVRTAPLLDRWIERLLAAHEPPLTVAQYLALQAIADGDVVGAELARRAAVSPSAVSQLLAALEDAGLIVRRRLADDRRRQPLALTPAGETLLGSTQAVLRDRVALLLADLPRPEADALAAALERLLATLGGTPPPLRPPPRHPPPRHPRRRPAP
jgi:DNA-binding MarR family transcriptional regulator